MAEQSERARAGGKAERSATRRFAKGLARAFAGALLFSLPMLMTMEMWWLGFSMTPGRLALLLGAMLPLLLGLSYFSGFEETHGVLAAAVDALVAFAVGCVASALVLGLFGVLRPDMCLGELIGKVAIQTVPGSIGALLAQSQFGQKREEERKRRRAGYVGELFFMGVGAVFLGANVAPTEEMVLIAYQMTHGHTLVLAGVSIVAMHAFVYAVEFRGQETVPEGHSAWSAFLCFTGVGYALVLLISAYLLWTCGRFDGTGWAVRVQATVVLGLPGAMGAAAARLIL